MVYQQVLKCLLLVMCCVQIIASLFFVAVHSDEIESDFAGGVTLALAVALLYALNTHGLLLIGLIQVVVSMLDVLFVILITMYYMLAAVESSALLAVYYSALLFFVFEGILLREYLQESGYQRRLEYLSEQDI